MTENEERISVLLTKNPCKECPVKKCTRKCMFGILFEKAPGITRQEAIECMAKAIRKELFKNEGPTQKIKEQGLEKEYYEYVGFYCISIAESALNALLSLQSKGHAKDKKESATDA